MRYSYGITAALLAGGAAVSLVTGAILGVVVAISALRLPASHAILRASALSGAKKLPQYNSSR